MVDNIIEKKVNGQYHCDDGPAVTFIDGVKMYFIRGVLVDSDLIEKTPEELQPEDYSKYSYNIDVASFFLNKIGGYPVKDPFGHAQEPPTLGLKMSFGSLILFATVAIGIEPSSRSAPANPSIMVGCIRGSSP